MSNRATHKNPETEKIHRAIEDYKTDFLAGKNPDFAVYLRGFSKEKADEIREFLSAWQELQEIDGTLKFLAEVPSDEEQLKKLKRRFIIFPIWFWKKRNRAKQRRQAFKIGLGITVLAYMTACIAVLIGILLPQNIDRPYSPAQNDTIQISVIPSIPETKTILVIVPAPEPEPRTDQQSLEATLVMAAASVSKSLTPATADETPVKVEPPAIEAPPPVLDTPVDTPKPVESPVVPKPTVETVEKPQIASVETPSIEFVQKPNGQDNTMQATVEIDVPLDEETVLTPTPLVPQARIQRDLVSATPDNGLIELESILDDAASTEMEMIHTAFDPQESPIEMELAELPYDDYLDEYQAIAEKLKVQQTRDEVAIMGLQVKNPTDTPVRTTLGDIVPLVGNVRYPFVAYLLVDSMTAAPTYSLPNWETPLEVNAHKRLSLKLVFIAKTDERPVLANELKMYACFKHPPIRGLNFSISVSHRGKDDWGNAGGRIGKTEMPQFSPSLSQVAARQLRPPKTAVSAHDSRPALLEQVIGSKGEADQMPYWFGIAKAIESGDFDYATAIRVLNYVADSRSRLPHRWSRMTTWSDTQRLLIAPTEERVYFATSFSEEIMALPHEVAKVFLYTVEEAFSLNIKPEDAAPQPGGYKHFLSPTRGMMTGFELECSGIRIRAERVGNHYDIEVFTERENPSKPLRLTYNPT